MQTICNIITNDERRHYGYDDTVIKLLKNLHQHIGIVIDAIEVNDKLQTSNRTNNEVQEL